MKTCYIASLLEGDFPENQDGTFFVIGVKYWEQEEDDEDFDEYNPPEDLSLENLKSRCKNIIIDKRFIEVVNPKYMGYGKEYQHILQPAFISFRKPK